MAKVGIDTFATKKDFFGLNMNCYRAYLPWHVYYILKVTLIVNLKRYETWYLSTNDRLWQKYFVHWVGIEKSFRNLLQGFSVCLFYSSLHVLEQLQRILFNHFSNRSCQSLVSIEQISKLQVAILRSNINIIRHNFEKSLVIFSHLLEMNSAI